MGLNEKVLLHMISRIPLLGYFFHVMILYVKIFLMKNCVRHVLYIFIWFFYLGGLLETYATNHFNKSLQSNSHSREAQLMSDFSNFIRKFL